MAVVESLVEYKRGDSSKPKPPSKVTRPKVGETRDCEATLLRNDQAKALVARMAKAKIIGRISRLGPIASYVMVHIGHGTALRGKL